MTSKAGSETADLADIEAELEADHGGSDAGSNGSSPAAADKDDPAAAALLLTKIWPALQSGYAHVAPSGDDDGQLAVHFPCSKCGAEVLNGIEELRDPANIADVMASATNSYVCLDCTEPPDA